MCRFNATNMLEKLRNKRVVIVGDSLNRNMWESLACLLYTSIPSSRSQVQAESSSYKVLKALVCIFFDLSLLKLEFFSLKSCYFSNFLPK